jgi:hypothetical protein
MFINKTCPDCNETYNVLYTHRCSAPSSWQNQGRSTASAITLVPSTFPLSGLGIGVLCWLALIALTEANPTPVLVQAILCSPMLIADIRQHHNKLAIAALNGTLVALAVILAYSRFGGLLLIAPVFLLSSIGWFVALVWSCMKIEKWEK